MMPIMKPTMENIQALMDRVANIKFHVDMGPTQVKEIRAELSEIFALARPMHMIAKRDLDRYDRMRRNAEKRIPLLIEKEQGDGKKLTEKLREALAVEYLETTPLEGTDKPIYQLIDEATGLYLATEALMEMIRDKNETLIAIRDMINAERSLEPAF